MTSYQDGRTTRRSIWVGVDGSSASLAAVRWAADEALSRRLPVTLCYASPSVSPGDGHAWAVLSVARDELHRRAPSIETTSQAIAAATAPALVRASERAALLVLGSTGSGNPDEVLLGSTTLAVAGQAHCPVVGVRRWPMPSGTKRTVVVGVSSPWSDGQAIEVAWERAHRTGCELVVVHASRERRPTSSHIGWDGLSAALDVWRRRYPEVTVRLQVRHGSPVTALTSRADRVESVVTGCRRRGQAARVLVGSTSRALLRRSDVPVIVTNPDLPSSLETTSVAGAAELDPQLRSELW